MSNLALRRGRGPVFPDLPPTLQPGAIAAAAPPSDTARSALFAGLIYLSLVGGALAFASLAPPVIVASPAIPPFERVIEIEGPVVARPQPPQPPLVSGGGEGGGPAPVQGVLTHREEAGEPAAGLPTKDRSQELPVGPALGSGPVAAVPAVAPIPRVHDFSLTGLSPVHRVDPIYPDFARRAHVQGTVVLMMVVDEQGLPVQVRALEGHPTLQEAAMQAARQWRFEPARLDGRPVSASFRLTLNFRLK